MFQIQKYCSKLLFITLIIIAFPSLIFAKSEAAYRNIADLKLQKERMSAIFGCAKTKDTYCAEIRNADSEAGLWMAVSEKKQNDDKQTTERISVLECCLGVDTKNSCDSLSPGAQTDLGDCKKMLSK